MTLVRLEDPAAARAWCDARRAEGRSLGFVPTMGALHAGHLALVERAARENDVACVSVFVNPLQFDDPRDLAAYPRDFDGDARLLESVGCGLVFTGTLAGFFPEVPAGEEIPLSDPGPGAAGLEGEHRQGHFGGVATIVRRLFEVVGPARAYFGEKDFQQTLVVQHVAANMEDGPRIVVVPTSREPDGLARSSRNLLLEPAERTEASVLSRALRAARSAYLEGERDPARLSALMHACFEGTPAEPEYAEVRDPERWSAERPARLGERARALVAARLGRVRLIDNLSLSDDGAADAGGQAEGAGS